MAIVNATHATRVACIPNSGLVENDIFVTKTDAQKSKYSNKRILTGAI